ncbi:hypothetical protein ACFL27_18135 [candidate division CSSED10-310 bacterium]|uniref:Uncharacterized protein n=1 Tax=candidate division CSSED10-310 bacterium TaxID=2855610 RepID=A0ABV6Z101_UNCC1
MKHPILDFPGSVIENVVPVGAAATYREQTNPDATFKKCSLQLSN